MSIRDFVRWHHAEGDSWFVPKFFGFGATPVTWQGWAAVAAYLALLFAVVLSGLDPIAKLVLAVLLTGAFVWVTALKTDGVWRFRWGGGDKR